MRIWLCPSAFFPRKGGVEELSLKLAQQLARNGHDVLVVTHGDEVARDRVEGIEVLRVHFASPRRALAEASRFLTSQRSVQRLLSGEERPDVIHIQCPSNQTAALAYWSRRHKVPLVITTQGETVMDAEGIYQRSLYLRSVLKLASAQASALTACSKWTAQQAAVTAPRFADARVILNGVESTDWSTSTPTPEPVFCAWGRHVPQKGFDLLLAAFACLRERLPTAQLLLGGDGPEHQRLSDLAGAGVTLLGALDRAGVADLLRRSRVAVVPSRIEPFGIVALEALASGRQLVYSCHGGLGEAAGGLGVSMDPFDTAAFAEAMERAATLEIDPSAGPRRAHELSWESITREYESVYAEVVGGR